MPSLHAVLLLALQAQRASGEPLPSSPTGLEWMPIASIVVPAVLLVVIIYLGTRRRV